MENVQEEVTNEINIVELNLIKDSIDKMVKIVGGYDNEIGYSSRIIDLILFLSKNKY